MDDDEIRICMIHPKFPRRREFLTNKRLSARLVLYRTLFVRKDELDFSPTLIIKYPIVTNHGFGS